VYDVNLHKRVELDFELPTILRAIRWDKLYDEPRPGSRLLSLEFHMTFDSLVRPRKSYVCFCLFGRRYEFAYPQFSELMDFSTFTCLSPKPW
jgi:hypothetical protein